MASSLTTVPGKLLTVFFVTHYSDALAPKRVTCFSQQISSS